MASQLLDEKHIHLYSSNQIDSKETRKHIHTNIRNIAMNKF